MYRITIVLSLAVAVLAACSGEESGVPSAPTQRPNVGSTIVPVTPVARPAAVPQAARTVIQTATLGRIIRRADEAPQAVMPRRLLAATCENDLMVLETGEETIYAALPCDSFWDTGTRETFVDSEVAIVLEVGEVRFRVLVETLAGARTEFTVAGIWVE